MRYIAAAETRTKLVRTERLVVAVMGRRKDFDSVVVGLTEDLGIEGSDPVVEDPVAGEDNTAGCLSDHHFDRTLGYVVVDKAEILVRLEYGVCSCYATLAEHTSDYPVEEQRSDRRAAVPEYLIHFDQGRLEVGTERQPLAQLLVAACLCHGGKDQE